MNNKAKYIISLFAGCLLIGTLTASAAGPKEPSVFSNPLALIMLAIMMLLLVMITLLAMKLIKNAGIKSKIKQHLRAKGSAGALLTVLFLLLSSLVFAQEKAPDKNAVATAANTIGGLAPSAFYILLAAILIELLIAFVLFFNLRSMRRTKEEQAVLLAQPDLLAMPVSSLSWWDRFNKLRPVEQEAELDLGHDYDGIRELNNKLPPWWLYGFYVTIVFAAIYLWRYHVSHTAPLSAQEYERSVKIADAKVNAYLKVKGEVFDESSIQLLTDAKDLEAGKAIFTRPGLCGVCHGNDGSGIVNGVPGVGPNLTDDYWIHGGSIKDIFKVIKYGVSGKGMQEWGSKFSPKELAQIASFVKSLQGTNPPQKKAPDGPLYKEDAPPPAQPAADSGKAKNPG
ncbi:MAG: c-type cytochrome [Bacteroidetes bacterium]|nr:c-type cytochrome [Bacteroidota bacterium]